MTGGTTDFLRQGGLATIAYALIINHKITLGCQFYRAPETELSLTKVIWLPKDAKTADGYVPAEDDELLPPGVDDFDPEVLGQ